MDANRQTTDQLLKAVQEEEQQKPRGHLKIFFGYAAGVGKTYSMLKAAHAAKRRGVDVVVGHIESHAYSKTAALLNGLELLPNLNIESNGLKLHEFDIDAAIARKPQLVLVDELAHTNAEGCRHTKRYQDVEELLRSGIDVCTTVNVQQIESLNDMVAAITGASVRERIPDSVFDNADQVELVDIEPQDLIERIKTGNVCKKAKAEAVDGFFTVEKLTALREVALRRCADRVNILTENARIKNHSDYHTDEHILVCLSSSPSNAKIIRTAARMANAFRGAFTALFVETPDFSAIAEEDVKRLHANMRLAEQLGAKIETVYGEDVPFQIVEFARLSGVSKIVIGRSAATRRSILSKPTLTEKLIASAPNLDVHIIPDTVSDVSAYRKKAAKLKKRIVFSAADILKSVGILVAASCMGFLFYNLGFDEANIITVYVLGVLLISVFTTNQIYSLISSVVSVLVFNFLFTEPKYTLLAYDKGYPVTFLVMFAAAFLTGSLAVRLKEHAKQSAQAAFRRKVLFDTNQLLQTAVGRDEIISTMANQLMKLLGKDIIVYCAENGTLGNLQLFHATEEPFDKSCISDDEKAVAMWVLKNNKHAGATTDTLSNAKCLYLAIRINDRVYGVVGIVIGDSPLDAFENSILLSILGECALALESEKNAREKEEAAVIARNEQLRANLLRAISHDLRTPLTSISGNASNLLSNGDAFDADTKQQLYTDIYDDSMWLINLVENLLSVTRLEENRLNLNISENLMDDVIAEALRHVNRKSVEHHISVESKTELLLAKMDAKLIVQVVINIVDNAIKYTPKGSNIRITTEKQGNDAVVSIADNGEGIPDEIKPRIFDMFYSGANKIADSRRSLGLGLSLCKSIINAHGGKITVSDNTPHGAVFTFTLPAGEVQLHE